MTDDTYTKPPPDLPADRAVERMRAFLAALPAPEPPRLVAYRMNAATWDAIKASVAVKPDPLARLLGIEVRIDETLDDGDMRPIYEHTVRL